jgi:hypothetical protein
MAAAIPTKEPETVTAGVTWTWKKSLADYKASDSWVLTYYPRKNGIGLSAIAATADGDDHLVALSYGVSGLYAVGLYDLKGVVAKGSEKFQVFDGFLEVLPNPAQSGAFDPRTHAQTVLDSIEAVLESRATKEVLSFSVEGNSLSSYPHEQLLAMRSRYRVEVEREKAVERLKAGRGSGRLILTRFQ